MENVTFVCLFGILYFLFFLTEFDLDSGEIVQKCDMAAVLSDQYRTVRNWADINSI